MPPCAMKNCKNHNKTKTTNINPYITYHLFPVDELKRVEWIDIVRKQREEDSWQPTKYSKLCSAHFRSEDMYKSAKGYTFLKYTAVPNLRFPSWTQNSSEAMQSSNSPSEEEVSISESILETSQEAASKNCIRKISLEKDTCLNKNTKLQRQNVHVENYASDEQFTESDEDTEMGRKSELYYHGRIKNRKKKKTNIEKALEALRLRRQNPVQNKVLPGTSSASECYLPSETSAVKSLKRQGVLASKETITGELQQMGVSTTQIERVQSNDTIEVTQMGVSTTQIETVQSNYTTEVTDTPLPIISETEAAVASLSDPYGFNLGLEEEKEPEALTEPENDHENEDQPLYEELSSPDMYDYFAKAFAKDLRCFPAEEGTRIMKKIKTLMKRWKNEFYLQSSNTNKTEKKTKNKPSVKKTKIVKTDTKKKPAGRTTNTSMRASGKKVTGTKAPRSNTKKRPVEVKPVNAKWGKKQKTVPVIPEDIPQASAEESSNAAEQSKPEMETEQSDARYRYLKSYLAEKNAAAAKETPPVQPIQMEGAEPEIHPPQEINPIEPDPLTVKVETTEDIGNQFTTNVIGLVESGPSLSYVKIEQDERCDSPEEYVEITEKY